MSNRQNRRDEMRAKVDTWVDGLGMPVDEGIKDLVVVCNLLNMRTDASCFGHLPGENGHEQLSAPWLSFRSAEEARLWKEIDRIGEKQGVLRDGRPKAGGKSLDKFYQRKDVQKLNQQREREAAVLSTRVIEYLHEFYKSRKRKPYIFLQVSQPLGLASEGSEVVAAFSKSEQKRFLDQSRQEFMDFKEFLEFKYFGQ